MVYLKYSSTITSNSLWNKKYPTKDFEMLTEVFGDDALSTCAYFWIAQRNFWRPGKGWKWLMSRPNCDCMNWRENSDNLWNPAEKLTSEHSENCPHDKHQQKDSRRHFEWCIKNEMFLFKNDYEQHHLGTKNNRKNICPDIMNIRNFIMTEWKPEGHIVNQKWNRGLLIKQPQKIGKKRVNSWRNNSWFLHQDNSPVIQCPVREVLFSEQSHSCTRASSVFARTYSTWLLSESALKGMNFQYLNR